MTKGVKITVLGALIIITSFIVSKKGLLADKSEHTSIVESYSENELSGEEGEVQKVDSKNESANETESIEVYSEVEVYSETEKTEKPEYIAYMVAYSKNTSHIEYPQIKGMENVKLQEKINKLLKEETIKGPKIDDGKNFDDFWNSGVTYEYSNNIGFMNEFLASFLYSFEALDSNSTATGMNRRSFCITLNMKTGEKINLIDFMEMDEHLINSGLFESPGPLDGKPAIFYGFKDAFGIYASEEEKDNLHTRTPEMVIESLKDPMAETNWFIEQNKDITFFTDKSYNSISIPLGQISDAVHLKYLKMLGEYIEIYSESGSMENPEYVAYIESYLENISYIEYPQVKGMENVELQKKINKLLKEETIKGAKISGGKNFVDFWEPGVIYDYSSGINFTNEFLASFSYTFEASDPSSSVTGMNYRTFFITVNMKTGEKVSLTEFMAIDDRLINSGVPDAPEPDYNGVVTPKFYRFKDAFEIYTSEEEKDSYHMFTPEEVINELKDKTGETKWVIRKNKDITFYTGLAYNFVTIPFTEISNAIHPEYLEMLGK